jgi:Rrf2 family iron-sulfur cluster assembly transcriptional regulator
MLFANSRNMLRLSKRVEYGLVALQHLAKRSAVSTVREIADVNGISYDLLAKIMQDLKRDGIILSQQGVRGGYTMILAPEQISLSRVLNALEAETSITVCTSGGECCEREAVCTIKGPMHKLQNSMEQMFDSVTIAQLL